MIGPQTTIRINLPQLRLRLPTGATSELFDFSVIVPIQDCDLEAHERQKSLQPLDFTPQRMSTTQQLLIVIATYNERDNLPNLVTQLFQLIPDVSIVVVDDNSPDGTGKWCESATKKYERLHHIGRPGKSGLGSATMVGLQFARDRQFEFVATMDADFSHCPKSMQKMWQHVLERRATTDGEIPGALIGSRYIVGGRIVGWPWHRRLASLFVNRFARAILRLSTKDNTGAFRVYHTQALRDANVFEMKTSGFAYLEETLFLLKQAQFEMHEFPITFVDREKGKSKANTSEGVKVLWNILQLRFRR